MIIEKQDDRSMVLRELLLRADVEKYEGEESILFYMPGNYYFTASMLPLIYRYIQAGKQTVIFFVSIDSMLRHGNNNVENMIEIIEKLEDIGMVWKAIGRNYGIKVPILL